MTYDRPTSDSKPSQPLPSSQRGRIAAHPWAVFLLPLVVYMALGTIEPTPEKPGGAAVGLNIPYDYYPIIYATKIALTLAAVVLVGPGYRQFPLRVGPLAIAVGVVGAGVWIGLCTLQRTWLAPYVPWLDDIGVRSEYDPLSAIEPAWAAWSFLAVRFFGLVALVPLIEEVFYRGFLMPFAVRHEWWTVAPGEVNRAGIILSVVGPLLLHPGEPLAAVAWFSMITWLFVRTRNLWDCVAAHAITNAILGVYVVTTGNWWLW